MESSVFDVTEKVSGTFSSGVGCCLKVGLKLQEPATIFYMSGERLHKRNEIQQFFNNIIVNVHELALTTQLRNERRRDILNECRQKINHSDYRA